MTLQDRYACRFCNKVLAEHTTHFKEHLETCKRYVKQTASNTIQNSNPFNIPVKANSNQSQINFPSLMPARKKELDVLAAMWCFLGNFPFNMYEHAAGKMFLKELNPAYKPPGRKTIAGPLLNSVYTMTKSRTDDMVATMNLINITMDESSNIRGSRICNISIHSPSGSLHYISEDICAKQMTAAAAAQWLRNHLIMLSNSDLSRIKAS